MIEVVPFERSEYVDVVSVNFSMVFHRLPLAQMITHSDWEAIDAQLANLQDLRLVVLMFAAKADLLLFHTSVILRHMPFLHGSGKASYALANGRMDVSFQPKWIKCRPETIEEGTYSIASQSFVLS